MKLEKRLFGTNGVRGVVGQDMNPQLVLRIGSALGSMKPGGTIAVGRDTRTSGEALAAALKAGLMASGCSVIDVGVVPTPGLQFIVRNRFDGGAMITASHNPPEYNGVKVIDGDGTEMGDADTLRLEERIFNDQFETASWEHTGRERRDTSLLDIYIDGVLSRFPHGAGKDLVVVVDPGSGAGAHTTPAILSRLGCRTLTINAAMDGKFSGRLPEPSREGLTDLSTMVTASGAAFGVAHDGDADRSVFIDEKGQYVEENYEFALIARYLCGKKKGIVVAPVSTSSVVEEVVRSCGSTVEYTPVGSIYVARRMLERESQGDPVVMGGEGNGGLIFPDHQFCRDGAMTAAMMVHILAVERRPLSELVASLPSFYMMKDKIHTGKGVALMKALEGEFGGETIDKTDGLKIIRKEGWALIRASGTEPLIRIMVESAHRETTERMYEEIGQTLQRVQKRIT